MSQVLKTFIPFDLVINNFKESEETDMQNYVQDYVHCYDKRN